MEELIEDLWDRSLFQSIAFAIGIIFGLALPELMSNQVMSMGIVLVVFVGPGLWAVRWVLERFTEWFVRG